MRQFSVAEAVGVSTYTKASMLTQNYSHVIVERISEIGARETIKYNYTRITEFARAHRRRQHNTLIRKCNCRKRIVFVDSETVA